MGRVFSVGSISASFQERWGGSGGYPRCSLAKGRQEKPLGRSVSVVDEGQARISEAGPEGTEERSREEFCLLAPWWL